MNFKIFETHKKLVPFFQIQKFFAILNVEAVRIQKRLFFLVFEDMTFGLNEGLKSQELIFYIVKKLKFY